MSERLVLIAFSILMLTLGSCTTKEKITDKATLFKLLAPEQTGITFNNQLTYSEQLNPYTYKNFYNGGGVGLGDLDGDGLTDIFFSGSMVSSKLYLNKGKMKFEDITQKSGLNSEGIWTTGVSIADINGDGMLDIYLCKSGPPGGANRANELFINNGNLTFTEKAKDFGLDFQGLSTHAAFFDYDKDGDLDCYLLNNSIRSVGGYDLRVGQRNIPDPLGGNKLLRNDAGKFTDMSAAAGIYTSQIGFGLGVTIGDLNVDGWPDMYVSNDFFERDYLYINQKDGTFKETLENCIQELSMGSMGADMADINNDGLPEVFVTEMLPEHDFRLKTTTQFESWDKYQLGLKNGYHRQFSRNVLQLANDNGTFSEISRLSGVDATDWSWGALIFDMDNDGLKDIYVANGIYKELLNQDYVHFSTTPEILRDISQRKKGVIMQLVDSIPSVPLSNYAFKNNGDLTFTNKSAEWGLDLPMFSNGSAYGDLDNDGDIDLVLNNVNMSASIYENTSTQILKGNSFLSIKLHGDGANTFAVGAKVKLNAGNKTFYQELSPMRGFMSSVDNKLNFGLGENKTIDSVITDWPDGRQSLLRDVKTGQQIDMYQKDAATEKHISSSSKESNVIFHTVQDFKGASYLHVENEYSDFDRDRLLFTMSSNEGPCLCSGDVNHDGLTDFYIGGAKDQAGSLFIQQQAGTFKKSNEQVMSQDKLSEDTDCRFFDANGDGKDDLYVTSGGSEFSSSSLALLDRLYINQGNGVMKKSAQLLPVSTSFESTSTVDAADYDNDGDLDLFVGARLIPFSYGSPANGFILNNDGKGNFTNVTKTVAPGLSKVGMITEARWVDVNNDKKKDLLIVGEWMSIKLFLAEGDTFTDRTETYGFLKTDGWYHALETGDFNKDGYQDFIAGNFGLNTSFKASEHEPVSMYINDFDGNGTVEQITTCYDNGVSYPVNLRQDMISQMPSLKKKFLHYRNYANKTISDIFSPAQRKGEQVLNAYTSETSVWINNKNGSFTRIKLPTEAQVFPIYAISIADFTHDGIEDILLGGNQFKAKPQTGIYAGGYGLLLAGDGTGNFKTLSANKSGMSVTGEIRAFDKLSVRKKNFLLVARSNDSLKVLSY